MTSLRKFNHGVTNISWYRIYLKISDILEGFYFKWISSSS